MDGFQCRGRIWIEGRNGTFLDMATWTLAPKEAMRTGIYLFLMVALTTDALQRYREMLPALKGRLANEVQLSPIRDEEEALKYWRFYNDEARKAAKDEAEARGWQCGEEHIVAEAEVRKVFAKQRKLSSIEGIRQRDFLNELNRLASLASAS